MEQGLQQLALRIYLKTLTLTTEANSLTNEFGRDYRKTKCIHSATLRRVSDGIVTRISEFF